MSERGFLYEVMALNFVANGLQEWESTYTVNGVS
jgi:hypothetical protein